MKCKKPKQPANDQNCGYESQHDFISLHLGAKLSPLYSRAQRPFLSTRVSSSPSLRVSNRNVCSLRDRSAASSTDRAVDPVNSNLCFFPVGTTGPGYPMVATSLVKKSPLTSHAHSAEHVHDQQDDHDQPDNPYPSARPPSPISVVPSAATEQEHQDDNQQE